MGILSGVTKSIGSAINGVKNVASSLIGGSDSGSGVLGSILGFLTGGTGGSLLGSILGGDGVLGSVVKGAVGLGGDYMSNQWQVKAQQDLNDQTFKHNRALADEAYQRDVAMWNMQNAYNSPTQQMERLSKAGLNPNLVYGSGNVSGNTAGSAPSYPQVTVPTRTANKIDLARNLLGIYDQYQSIKNQALQNQRENAMIALREKALELSERREDNRDKQSQRQFEIMMANLGLAMRKQDYAEKSPKSWFGKGYYDLKNVGKDIEDIISGIDSHDIINELFNSQNPIVSLIRRNN